MCFFFQDHLNQVAWFDEQVAVSHLPMIDDISDRCTYQAEENQKPVENSIIELVILVVMNHCVLLLLLVS